MKTTGWSVLLVFSLFAVSTAYGQRAKHGDYTVPGANTIVNTYTFLTADATAGGTSITVNNNAMNGGVFGGALEPGDLILIIQMQGATMDIDISPISWPGTYTIPFSYSNIGWGVNPESWGQVTALNNCGRFDKAEVLSVSGSNTINLQCPLRFSYTAASHVQVVRIPRFNNLTVPAATSIEPAVWDGQIGGITSVEVEATLDLQAGGSISASEFGFRGGELDPSSLPAETSDNSQRFLGTYDNLEGSEKGEGIGGYHTEYDALFSRYGIGAPANGGGGGGYANTGGGGGAHVALGTYTGLGNPNGYVAIWNLEDPTLGGSTSPGGGRGGYSLSDIDGDETTQGPNNQANWGADSRKTNGGYGGHQLSFNWDRIYFGGGGGAGDQDSDEGGAGGRGGGLVYIISYGTITGTGTVEASGEDGQDANWQNLVADAGTPRLGNDGAGGGGAGGTIRIENANALPGITLDVHGGDGGDQNLSIFATSPPFPPNNPEAGGPGGSGAGGIVTYVSGAPTTVLNGGVEGTTTSAHVTNFPPNGATRGSNALSLTGVPWYDIIANDQSVCAGAPVTLTISTAGTVPGTINWYTTQFGGAPVNTGTSYNIGIPGATATYYVGVCPGSFRTPVTVTVNPAPIMTLQDTTNCAPATIDLTNTTYWTADVGTLSYWSDAVLSVPIPDPTVVGAGTYYIEANNAGCSNSGSVTVTINTTPIMTLQDTAVCAPTLVDLTNTTFWTADIGVLSYWTDAGLTTPIPDPTAVGPGTYYISSNNLGCIASGSVDVINAPTPLIAAVGSDPTTCNGSDGSIEVTLTSGPTSSGILNWTGTSNGSNNPADITVDSPDISSLTAGSYDVTFTDAAGCVSNMVNVVLANPTAPVITPFAPNPVVACDSAQLPTIVGTDITAAAAWYTGPGATGTQMAVGDWVTSTMTMYAYDSTNTVPTCWDEESLDFTISVTPTMTLQDTTDCSPTLIDLTNTTYWTSDVGTLAYWSDAGLSVAIPDPTMVGAGTYYVEADNNGCTNSGSVTITINTTPTMTLQDTTVCSPTLVDLANTTYWTSDLGTLAYWTDAGLTTPIPDPTMVGAGTYYISADNLGCINSGSVTVSQNAAPVIAAVGSDPSACNATDGSIEVTLTSGPLSTGVLDWTGTASGSNNPADVTVDSPDIGSVGAGTYNVTFTDDNGCVSNTVIVNLNNPNAPIINAFAPNPVIACDSAQLPAITGTDLTAALSWWTGPGATGTQMNVGDWITSTTTMYAYDSTNTVPTCWDEESLDFTISVTPTMTLQDTTDCSPALIDLTNTTFWTSDLGTLAYWSDAGLSVAIPDPTMVGAGTYYVEADNNGCTNSGSVTVTINTTPTLTLQDTTNCSPTLIDLTNTTYWSTDLGTLAYWTDAGLTMPIPDPTMVGTGTYYISADNLGCISSGPVNVTINTAPTMTLQDTTDCTPTLIDLTDVTYWSADLGTLSYWTDAGLTTPVADPTMVGSGTYYISADNFGCVNSGSVTVTINTTPTMTLQDTTNCSPVLIDLTNTTYWTADVGVLAYWTDAGLTTPIPDPTMVGTGTYYISSANNGCTASGPVDVTINTSPVIAAVGSGPFTCNATDGSIEVTLTSGPLSTGVLDWTGTASGSNNPADITVDSPDIGTLGAGSYDVTFTDDNGCVSNTVNVALSNPGAPIIDPFVPNPVVACDSAQLPAIVGTNITAAAAWYTGPNASGTQMAVGDWVTSTMTMYAYDSTNTVPTCWDEETLDFTINVTPTMTLMDTTNCSPMLIDLTNTTFWTSDVGTLSYWSDAGLSVAIPDPTMVGAGTYYIEADNNSCTSSGSVTVTINTTPTMTLQDTTDCTPTLIDLTNTTYWTSDVGTLSYWTDAGLTTPIADPTQVGTGTYYISADNLGCINSGQVNVTINTTPTMTLQDTTDCSPNLIDLTNATYWTADVGTLSYWTDAGLTTPIVDPTQVGAGTYYISADNLGCINSGSVIVTINTTPTLTVQDTMVCSPLTVDLTNTAFWTADVGTLAYYSDAGLTTAVADPTQVGTGTYYIEANNLGCSASEPVTVTQILTPAIDPITDISVCDSYALPVIIGTDLTGAEGFYAQTGGVSPIVGPITTTQTIFIYDGNAGCSDEESFTVTVNYTEDASFTLTDFCEGDVNSATITGASGGVFTFNPQPAGTEAIDAASGEISNGVGGTTYSIQYTTTGVCPDSLVQTVTVFAIPVAPTVSQDQSYCTGDPISDMTASGGAGTITWYDDATLSGMITTGGTLTPFSNNGTTVYYVTETENGCESPSASISITIEPCDVIIPTAITPNADGVNDDWELSNLDQMYPNNIVHVYNRWGNLIFTSEPGDYDNNRWDGTFKGEMLPVGSYYFIIDYNDGETDASTGAVSIILE